MTELYRRYRHSMRQFVKFAVVGGSGPATIAGTTWDTYALGTWNSVTKTWEAP